MLPGSITSMRLMASSRTRLASTATVTAATWADFSGGAQASLAMRGWAIRVLESGVRQAATSSAAAGAALDWAMADGAAYSEATTRAWALDSGASGASGASDMAVLVTAASAMAAGVATAWAGG